MHFVFIQSFSLIGNRDRWLYDCFIAYRRLRCAVTYPECWNIKPYCACALTGPWILIRDGGNTLHRVHMVNDGHFFRLLDLTRQFKQMSYIFCVHSHHLRLTSVGFRLPCVLINCRLFIDTSAVEWNVIQNQWKWIGDLPHEDWLRLTCQKWMATRVFAALWIFQSWFQCKTIMRSR